MMISGGKTKRDRIMTMINNRQIKALISQSGPVRYEYFIKRAADSAKLWSLYKDGWSLASTDNENFVFPVWPSREFAEINTIGDWIGYIPREINMDDFLNTILPELKTEKISVAVFYTPQDKGVVVAIDRLLNDLKIELQKYE